MAFAKANSKANQHHFRRPLGGPRTVIGTLQGAGAPGAWINTLLGNKSVTSLAITPLFFTLSLCPNHSKAVVICNQGFGRHRLRYAEP